MKTAMTADSFEGVGRLQGRDEAVALARSLAPEPARTKLSSVIVALPLPVIWSEQVEAQIIDNRNYEEFEKALVVYPDSGGAPCSFVAWRSRRDGRIYL